MLKSLKILSVIILIFLGHGFGQSVITADFGSRAKNTQYIPSSMFGVNLSRLTDPTALNYLHQAGFTLARKMASIPQVYANAVPNWDSFDWNIKQLEPAGLHPVVVMASTPTWLQPTANPCVGLSQRENAPPTSVAKWAQIAASYVAHLDKTFPGFVTDYEIWNEPELQQSFCVADNTDATRLKTYLSLYAAAAAAMRAQANRDGVRIRIGGPTISRVLGSMGTEWVRALTSDPRTAPYVDFVSIHLYRAQAADILNGMTWSTLHSITQSGTRGLEAVYLPLARTTQAGKQPNATSTPVYITEYNDSYAFLNDCCRNNPTFAPLWNSVAVADFLNLAYAGVRIPRKIYYFAGSAYPHFCMFGTWNSTMNCDPTSLDPYPQYYSFKLFASTNYLGLSNGGYMAASISPASTQSGLMATAFYTSATDAIVIINPTGTTYSSVQVVAKNSGLSSTTGTVFVLNRANPKIASRTISLNKISGTYSTSVSIPAYSTVAITLH